MTLTYISCSSDFYTFYVNVPLSLGCMIRKISAEDIAIRGNGTGLEYKCPTRHFVYIFFNPVFQVSTAKNTQFICFMTSGHFVWLSWQNESRKSVKNQQEKETLLCTSIERRPFCPFVGRADPVAHQQGKKILLNKLI